MDILPDIGLMGRAQSGKDTAAAHLARTAGFTRVAFADALKEAAIDSDPYVRILDRVNGADGVRLSTLVFAVGWEEAKTFPEVRRFLQAFGVAMRDHVDPDVWVKAALLVADRHAPAVFSDVRFPNEAKAIRERGGILVRITRPAAAEALGANGDHVSETALDGFDPDATVANDGSIEQLHLRLDRIVAAMRIGVR